MWKPQTAESPAQCKKLIHRRTLVESLEEVIDKIVMVALFQILGKM